MDCRKDEIVFIEQRDAGLIACRLWRIQGQLSKKPFARRVGRRNLRKLRQLGLARSCVFVTIFHMRLLPAASEVMLGGPSCRGQLYFSDRCGELWPVFSRSGRRRERIKAFDVVA